MPPVNRAHSVVAASTLLVCTFAAGCDEENRISPTRASSNADSGWTEIPLGDAQKEHAGSLEIARDARTTLASTLLAELTEAMQSGGPEAAIMVCSERASSIASEVSDKGGVSIGRTSHQLRNSANTPPEWASAAVGARRDQPAVFIHGDGRVGELTPIRLMSNCLACHGSEAQLAAGVPGALARLYPDDLATGFAEGDLRGWFWVEVPPNANERR
ncbi:MAG: DUF3365 domain-containing protein [Planctomycetota bacterium]